MKKKTNRIMKVKVVNQSENQLPEYATPQSAGMDLRANIKEPVLLRPMERCLIPTGLHIQLPVGYEAQIRPRSGLALKYGITVLNTPGCVDSDYRGDVGVILINLSGRAFEIKPGERIAQMIVTSHEHVEWELVDELDESNDRGGGFGHTGVK